MDPHDFYQLASQLATSPHAAELRTAISRAYYATYHVGVTLLEAMGFRLSSGPAGHGEVRNRLSNSGDPEVMRVGTQLGQLHSQRIAADYRLRNTNVENPKTAQAVVQQARRMMRFWMRALPSPNAPRSCRRFKNGSGKFQVPEGESCNF